MVQTADTYHVCRVPGGRGSRLGLPVGAACQLLLSRLTPVKIAAMIEWECTWCRGCWAVWGQFHRNSFSGLTSLLSHCSFPNLKKTKHTWVANPHLNTLLFYSLNWNFFLRFSLFVVSFAMTEPYFQQGWLEMNPSRWTPIYGAVGNLKVWSGWSRTSLWVQGCHLKHLKQRGEGQGEKEERGGRGRGK